MFHLFTAVSPVDDLSKAVFSHLVEEFFYAFIDTVNISAFSRDFDDVAEFQPVLDGTVFRLPLHC